MPTANTTHVAVANLSSADKYFAHFEAEMHSDNSGNNRLAVIDRILGSWNAGTSRFDQHDLAYFENAVIGTTYYFRFRVVDKCGNIGAWSAWISEVAGDSTAPNPSYTPAATTTAAGLVVSAGPSGAPSDIDHYEHYWNRTGTSPAASTPGNLPPSRDGICNVTMGPSDIGYFWARAVDTSGNRQAWTSLGSWANGTIDNVLDGTIYMRSMGIVGSAIVLDNPSFALGTAGWYGAGIVQDSDSPYTNGKSMKKTTAQQYDGFYSSRKFKVAAGDKIFLSAYLKSDGVFGAYCQVIVYDAVGGVVAYGMPNIGPMTSGTWTKYSATATMPAGADNIQLNFARADANGGSHSGWITDIHLVRLANMDNEVADGAVHVKLELAERRRLAGALNLVNNGGFERGDDYNWRNADREHDQAFTSPDSIALDAANATEGGSVASFTGTGGTKMTSYLIPVNTSKRYWIEMRVKQSSGTPNSYLGFACFAADKTWISLGPAGATYNYNLLSGVQVPGSFTVYGGVISGEELAGNGSAQPGKDSAFTSHSKFRYRTKYICPLILPNYASSGTLQLDYVKVVELDTIVPAGTRSYRPLTNPLSSRDNGSNPVVSVADFPMRIGAIDVDVTGADIDATSGDYGKTAFVYYDDPRLVGGAVSFNITFTREETLADVGRLFVGSVPLPVSGGAARKGNNDGGAGGQYAKTVSIFPATYQTTGSWTNPGAALDDDLSSYAQAVTSSAPATYLGKDFPSFASWFTDNALHVLHQVTAISGGSPVLLEYSLNGGASWTTLRSITSVDADPVLSSVAVPLNKNTALVQVRFTVPGGSGSPTSATGNSSTVANDQQGGTVAWTNPTNAQGNQTSVYAYARNTTADSALDSYMLKMTNLGFSLPSGSTVNGIKVELTVKSNYVDSAGDWRYVMDLSARLYKAGTLTGNDKGQGVNWPTTMGVETYGGSSDLWGATWAYTDINDSGFGFGIKANLENGGAYSGGSGAQGNVYRVAVTVYYTASGGSQAATTRIFDISQELTF